MYRSLVLLLAAGALLAGCDSGGNVSFSFGESNDSVSNEGAVHLSGDSSGRAEIRAPGLEGSIRLPRIDIDAADFEVNGLKLYPGSTIKEFSLDASDREGERDDGKVVVAFEAPAALDKVQAWFRDNMAQRGFKAQAAGSGFAGTTNEGDPIRVELEADGTERSKGRMTIGR